MSGREHPGAWAEAITWGDMLLRSAARHGDAPAILTPTDRATYRELAEQAEHVARGLIGLGIRPGDRVAVLMPNSVLCAATMFGVSMAGATIVPINGRFRAVDVRGVLEDAEVSAVLLSDLADEYFDYAQLMLDAIPGLGDAEDPARVEVPALPFLRFVVLLGDRARPGTVGRATFDQAAAATDPAAVDARRAGSRIRDTAMILFTSGTTSRPSGCRLSHEAVVRDWTAVARVLGVTAEDRIWMPLPFFHMAGIGLTTTALSQGGAVITDLHFDAGRALEQLERDRATILYGTFPPVSLALIEHPRFAEADLSAVRASALVGTEPIMRRVQEALAPAVVFSTWGMTETAGVATITPLDDTEDGRLTSCGKALPGLEVAIADPETGELLGPDTPGEIVMRGPTLFDGYYGDPEKTARTFHPDGWMRSGDRGVMDADGRLRFIDRIKDMLRVGGENVASAEIEAWINQHPAVHMSQVVGVPDDRLDEVPAAFVELRPGATATEQDIIDHCKGKIASFKVPRHVRIVTEWPMSATKVQKFKLREQLVAELGRPEATEAA
jgi:acyl-CoA synthetase (AMP-forming)/AMP-acid ligase II